jgi:tetratricopeptide (TPR) repeat protein
MNRLIPFLSAIVVSAGTAFAQPALPQELKDAQTAMQAQKYTEAIAIYESFLKAADAKDPRPRAGIAAALYGNGNFERALPFALEAARLLEDPKLQLAYQGLPVGAVMVRIARIHNRLGHPDEAFTWLTRAANYPIPNYAALETEPDVANLHADARWKGFSDTVKTNADPCNNVPEYRQFDFWVGEWDVKNPGGQVVGTSRIERILNNCVIQETYTAVPGTLAAPKYVGQAFHFYDQNLKKWAQHYIDTTARPFDWVGEFKDGAMRFTREGPYGPSNSYIRQRMSFTPKPDGTVQQFFEQSADEGKTWIPGFNGTYVKRSGSGTAGGEAMNERAR